MNNRNIKIYIVGLVLMIISPTIKAQLFEKNELYPNVEVVEIKSYSGNGKGKYWSLNYVDSIGQVVKKESYHKNTLMARKTIEYDNNHNKLFVYHTYDYNNRDRVDTFRYEYKYTNSKIAYQYCKLSANDSTVIELVRNLGDTLLTYIEKNYYYRPKTKTSDVYQTTYNLKYKTGLLIKKEILNNEAKSKETRKYEYFENGRVKRRRIETQPKPIIKSHYSGGPGGNDELYKYKYDSQERVKAFYKVTNGKRYKIATYKYK